MTRMKHHLNRRDFLASTTLAAAGLGLAANLRAAEAAPFKTVLKKALINNQPTEDYLQKLKAAGYHGVEGGVIGREAAAQCRALAEKAGLQIHSVIRGWAEFNSPDPAKVKAGFDTTVKGIESAQGFGADAVLLVPCRIGGMAMPKPWEFDIEFDDKTGHVKSVVKGDNAPYQDYIKAHNHAIDTSTEWVNKLIPAAEKEKVVIALENVWNNLWVQPAIFAHFVKSFKSQWVRAYFDIGNNVKYAPSEEWILALGKHLSKCHAKDFKIDKAVNAGGKFVNIRDGDVNWPVVRQALEKVGYSGFLTIEGGNCSMEEHSQRLDLIFAGK
jgi:L-ribulose-5-phosphate 3-epimerase